jgi:hypothetical protein
VMKAVGRADFSLVRPQFLKLSKWKLSTADDFARLVKHRISGCPTIEAALAPPTMEVR